MNLLDGVPIPRKTMVLFFIVDTSFSMSGTRIGAVNAAIEEVVPELKNLSTSNADAQIKIAVMEFSTGARWLTKNGPVEAEQFVWNDISVSGVTDFGDACKELDKKLSVKEFMAEATGSFAPVILLLSDGGPTDNYQVGLEELKRNNWFKVALKIAIDIDGQADKSVLEEFTGNREAVVETRDAAALRKMIKFVSVRASQVMSSSANSGDSSKEENNSKQSDFIDDLKDFVDGADSFDSDDDDDGGW